MYCPNCHSEYREGFDECATCQVPLIDSLSDQDKRDPSRDGPVEYVVVFESNNPVQTGVVKSLLDAEGIPYLVRGEILQNLFGVGLTPLFSSKSSQVSIEVPVSEQARVQGLLNSAESKS